MMSAPLCQNKSFCGPEFRVRLHDFYGETDLIDNALPGGLPFAPQLQVFDSVVEPIAVDVVDVFVGEQLAPQMLSHYRPVDQSAFFVDANVVVAFSVDVAKTNLTADTLRGTGFASSADAGSVHNAKTNVFWWAVAAINAASRVFWVGVRSVQRSAARFAVGKNSSVMSGAVPATVNSFFAAYYSAFVVGLRNIAFVLRSHAENSLQGISHVTKPRAFVNPQQPFAAGI